jgi:hypothetical protein
MRTVMNAEASKRASPKLPRKFPVIISTASIFRRSLLTQVREFLLSADRCDADLSCHAKLDRAVPVRRGPFAVVGMFPAADATGLPRGASRSMLHKGRSEVLLP